MAARTIIIRYPVVNPRPPRRHEFTIAIERVFAPEDISKGGLKRLSKCIVMCFTCLFIILVYGYAATFSKLKETFPFGLY